MISYLEDGVAYWRRTGFHHPFREPSYQGDGRPYHRQFAAIGFQPQHAEQVSFIELIDVPTSGRSSLKASDLNPTHLARLREWVLDGAATYIFIPSGVAGLLTRTAEFAWLPEKSKEVQGSLPVLARNGRKTFFRPFHFSAVGRYSLKRDRDLQLSDMAKLISLD